jgi:hypothetical protein
MEMKIKKVLMALTSVLILVIWMGSITKIVVLDKETVSRYYHRI